jgi:hypothetical protein
MHREQAQLGHLPGGPLQAGHVDEAYLGRPQPGHVGSGHAGHGQFGHGQSGHGQFGHGQGGIAPVRPSSHTVRSSFDMVAAATHDAMVRRIIWIVVFVVAIIAVYMFTH